MNVEVFLHDGTSFIQEIESKTLLKMDMSAQVPYIRFINKDTKEEIYLFKSSIKMMVLKESN